MSNYSLLPDDPQPKKSSKSTGKKKGKTIVIKSGLALTDLEGVGKRKESIFQRLNIYNVNDLLNHYPKRYEDRRSCRHLRDFLELSEEKYPVEVKVIGYNYLNTRSGKILKVIITDGQLKASLVCFNREYLKDLLTLDTEYIVFGDFQYKYNELQCSNFEFIEKGDAVSSLNFMRITPVYPLTEGMNQAFLRQTLYQALQINSYEEAIPQSLLKVRDLLPKAEAYRQVHFPDSYESLEKAVYRLKYYELFELELNIALKKYYFVHHKKKQYEKLDKDRFINDLIKSLPFKLTKGQLSAFEDVKKDLLTSYPMHRMVQGDVGCGKTMIATLAMLFTAEHQYQSAFMVPTEILARQHYNTLSRMLKDFPIRIELLLGGMKAADRKLALYRVKNGDSKIVIGTHALFSEGVQFASLALAVIDEHHKFGVRARAKLIDKGEAVNILVMTATPIPRTLALTAYGDLDISLVKEKPRAKTVIHSRYIASEKKRNEMFEFIDKEIEKGRQGFVVCPMIEDSDKLEDISSVMTIYEDIQTNRLTHRKLSVLHGRHSSEEKEAIMSRFVSGDIDILVSTTVIEVGVDVPNATIMVIENAERFGLSQLHQLRGRIGRGDHHGVCFFVTLNKLTEDGKLRMKAIIKHNDGFKLSEEDLKIRGPGEFLGSRQSGVDSLKLANLIEDEDILLKAKEDAFRIVESDPRFDSPEHEVLRRTVYEPFVETNRILLTN